MSECILEMQDILVQRGQNTSLNIEQLMLKQGELVGVIGPNGAGKSTLLQVVNLLQAYHGQLRLFGERACQGDKTLLRRRCSMVFQDSLLLNDTVFNNVALGLRFRKMSEQEIEERVYKALADFHCEHLAKRPALLLSGGEAKRVCIARALVTEPELLMLDEPFSPLDVTTREGMIGEIRKVAEMRKIAVLLVSHDFSEVLHFAKRALVIFNGSIVQDDTPEKIMRYPMNSQVAGLVGMDNIIPCTVTKQPNGNCISFADGIKFLYPGKITGDVSACCISGDALYLYEDTLASQRKNWVRVKGSVERVIPGVGNYRILVNGGEQIYSARLPSQQITVAVQSAQRIELTFDPSQVHMIC